MGSLVIPAGIIAIVCFWGALIVGFAMRPLRRRYPKLNLLPYHKALAVAGALFSLLHVLAQQ